MTYVKESIDTAPQDGTVILTDDGTVKYVSYEESNFYKAGWYLSTANGWVPEDGETGIEISFLDPQPEIWYPEFKFSK